MTKSRLSKIKHYFHVSNRDAQKCKKNEDFSYTQKLQPYMSDIKMKFKNNFESYQRKEDLEQCNISR